MYMLVIDFCANHDQCVMFQVYALICMVYVVAAHVVIGGLLCMSKGGMYTC